MSYIAQKTRISSLTIGGVDYTSSFVSFQVSDSSANRQGFVTTTGSLVLGQVVGGADITDYSRLRFKRGEPVILDVTTPGGSAVRHPRGYLYVVSMGYDTEAEQLQVELGCRITLAQLIDDPATILPLVPIALNAAQQTIQNCAAAFQTNSQYLYQNNQGNLVVGDFFSGDSYAGSASGAWVSVLGATALSASALQLTGAIPDEINLAYQVPENLDADETSKVDTSTVTNRYFISYPAVTYQSAPEEVCYETDQPAMFQRDSVRVVNTSNQTLQGDSWTIDGVTVANGDRVLLSGQGNKVDNGIWVVNGSGDWTRGESFVSYGTWTLVSEGSTYAGTAWRQENNDGTLVVGVSKQVWKQFNNESLTPIDCIGGVTTEPAPIGGDSTGCGNTPSAPSGTQTVAGVDYTEEPVACNAGWSVQQTPIYISVTNREESETYYEAPAGQVSRTVVTRYGPRVEVQGQYYADAYSYCASVYASRCNPSGNCPLLGSQEGKLGWTETNNFYSEETNELVKVTREEWKSLLEIAKPEDWRAGMVDGVPVTFNSNFDDEYANTYIMYSFSETEYSKEDNRNIEVTENWVSNAEKGVGLREVKPALEGIRTVTRRVSKTTSNLADRPDSINDVVAPTVEESTVIKLIDGKYVTPPTEAGPYIMDESIPLPLLFETQAEVDTAVNNYSFYLEKFTKGDAYGMVIAEALRPEIITGWAPGMPFRYSDGNGNVRAFRMDACSWGVNADEAIVATNGIWIGDSNGTVTLGSNLVGNSQPDMTATQGNLYSGATPTSGTPTPPANPTPPAPPTVDDETYVDAGAVAFSVDVQVPNTGDGYTHLFTAEMSFYGENGLVPVLEEAYYPNTTPTLVAFVAGSVFTSGSLLATDGTGSIPLENGGSLVTDTGVLVDDDLFS